MPGRYPDAPLLANRPDCRGPDDGRRGFDEQEAANLKLRSQLMIEVEKDLMEKKLTQQAAAEVLGISQPRVSDLKRGKVDKFTIDMLVNFLTKLGHNVSVQVA